MSVVRNLLYQSDLERVVREGTVDFFAGTTVLVTGATGMIGSCIVDLFMCYNHMHIGNDIRVLACSRNENSAKERFADYWREGSFSFVKASVEDGLPESMTFDYAIHAASLTSPDVMMKQPVDTMLSNILGMHNILEAARKCRAKRVLFVSSGEVYGNIYKEIKTESDYGYVDQLKVRAAYPVSKRAAETLCVAYLAQYGVDSVIVRPGHTYGPTMTACDQRASSAFIREAASGRKIIMKSTGQVVRSYIYVLDTVRAMILVLEKGTSGRAYNIAGEQVVSIRQFAEMASELGGQKIEFCFEKEADFKITRQVLDVAALRDLGWKADVDIREGIQKTIDILRDEHYAGNMKKVFNLKD